MAKNTGRGSRASLDPANAGHIYPGFEGGRPMAGKRKLKRPKQFKKLRSKGLSKTASERIANSKRRKRK